MNIEDIGHSEDGFIGYREGVPVFVIYGTDPALADISQDTEIISSRPFVGWEVTAQELGLPAGQPLHDLILLFPELGIEMRLGAEHLGTILTDTAHCELAVL